MIAKINIIAKARRLAFVIPTVLLLSCGISRGNIFYVKTSGNDTLSGASWALAKQSISNTIAAAAAGDQVWIASGAYCRVGNS